MIFLEPQVNSKFINATVIADSIRIPTLIPLIGNLTCNGLANNNVTCSVINKVDSKGLSTVHRAVIKVIFRSVWQGIYTRDRILLYIGL